MPRIRTLKPEHRQHRKIGPLSHLTYRLWVGMILEADDEGRLVCDSEQLRVTIFGYHGKVTGALLESSLTLLASLGLLNLYAINGIRYAYFPSWGDHQVISHPRPSKLPAYEASMSVLEQSENIPDDSGGKGRERNGREGKGRHVVMADDQFLESLRTNPGYAGLNIDRELAKMDAWLLTPKGRRRQKTRQFIVNWLNNSDRAMASGPDGKTAGNADAVRKAVARIETTPR